MTVSLEDVLRWPATVNVDPACAALGISRSLGYALIARGEFPARVIKVSNRYRVITASLVVLLAAEEVRYEPTAGGTIPT